jgi:Predicted metal-dependent hydrolase of the TIM-barrel fold
LRSPEVGAQLEAIGRHPKLVGVRHIAQSEPDDRFLLQPAFLRGIARLEEFDLAYDVLIYSRHLPVAAELAGRAPRQKLVLDHLAKPNIRGRAMSLWERDLRALAAHPNVYAKLSGLVTEADWTQWTPDDIRPYLDVAFDCFSAERLMIGSDWPVCTGAADYARTMAVVADYLADRSNVDREAVLGGNAIRFWNLHPWVTHA